MRGGSSLSPQLSMWESPQSFFSQVAQVSAFWIFRDLTCQIEKSPNLLDFFYLLKKKNTHSVKCSKGTSHVFFSADSLVSRMGSNLLIDMMGNTRQAMLECLKFSESPPEVLWWPLPLKKTTIFLMRPQQLHHLCSCFTLVIIAALAFVFPELYLKDIAEVGWGLIVRISIPKLTWKNTSAAAVIGLPSLLFGPAQTSLPRRESEFGFRLRRQC